MYPRPDAQDLHRAAGGEFSGCLFAYRELLHAHGEARDRRCPAQANLVAVSCFRDHGIADHVLLWMLYQAHIEHFRGPVDGDQGSGGAALTESLILTACSCFCLTETGAAFAAQFLADVVLPLREGIRVAAWDLLIVGKLLPRFDKDSRVFSWGQHILKHFSQPAVNQELVLSAAEEVGWQAWFDDPLPRCSGICPKKRLHDTIKDLNRRQTPYLIHFKGDGTGTRIGWDYR